MTTVSKENLRKVESFFVDTIKATGNKRIEATVLEIAEGAGVALATAHKAIKELDNRGTLSVIKPASRRFPITYIYCGDIEGLEISQSKDDQITYLQKLNEEKDETIKELQIKIRMLERKPGVNVMQNA